MFRSFWTFALIFAWAPLTTPVMADEWLVDYQEAKVASAASGKPILVQVIGSDWCIPCQQMESEVFSQPDFLAEAETKYTLLRLDFPRNLAQSEKIRVQNKNWAERYPFPGFPTVQLLDAQGLLYGQHSGYLAGGPGAFLKTIQGLQTQKGPLEQLVAAVKNSLPGEPRAKAQDALYRQAEAWNLESQYRDLPLKIVQEDKEGKAGLKARYQVVNSYQRLLATWAQGDFAKAAADFDTLATKASPWPELRQKILFSEGMVWFNALGDLIRARESLTRARTIDPASPTGLRAAELLDQLP